MSDTFQKWGYQPDGPPKMFTVTRDKPGLPEGWFESPDEANGNPSEATLRAQQEEARQAELGKAQELIAELQAQLEDTRQQLKKALEAKGQGSKAKGNK